jgi:hypothetical protein
MTHHAETCYPERCLVCNPDATPTGARRVAGVFVLEVSDE